MNKSTIAVNIQLDDVEIEENIIKGYKLIFGTDNIISLFPY